MQGSQFAKVLRYAPLKSMEVLNIPNFQMWLTQDMFLTTVSVPKESNLFLLPLFHMNWIWAVPLLATLYIELDISKPTYTYLSCETKWNIIPEFFKQTHSDKFEKFQYHIIRYL